MARNCSVCLHPKRLEIEQAMLAGGSLRDIADRYGTVNRGYLELRGELTSELGRDRGALDMTIQIICPVAPGGDSMPRITFASLDQIDSGGAGCPMQEIGVRQPI